MADTEYQDVTFAHDYRDLWRGLRHAKICKHCCDFTMHPHSECDYVVDALPAQPIRSMAGAPF